MVIKNLTRNTTLATNAQQAKSISAKLFGLLNKKNSSSMLFKTRFGIHTFFLKTEIDAIVLDSNGIVKIAKTLKPYRVLTYNPTYSTVIELPKGTILKSKTRIGDKLDPNKSLT